MLFNFVCKKYADVDNFSFVDYTKYYHHQLFNIIQLFPQDDVNGNFGIYEFVNDTYILQKMTYEFITTHLNSYN